MRSRTAALKAFIVCGSVKDSLTVEIEVDYLGYSTRAVREAVAQLFEYRYFLYEHGPRDLPTGLIALFSEPIAPAFPQYLEDNGIASVWSEDGNWRGSPRAALAGLTSDLT